MHISILQRLTVPKSLSRRQSHLSQFSRHTLPAPPATTRTPATTAKAKIRSEPDICARAPPTSKKKPKSETYKQVWPVLELQLLERLLSEIPGGEKNRYERLFLIGARAQHIHFRWSKISKAIRLWVIAALRVGLPATCKSISKN